jgi:hypothetical protein
VTYVTIEAAIADGKIVPMEGAQLPKHGRALVTLLPEASHITNWATVETSLGVLHRPNFDASVWQRKVRAEWDRV